MIASHQSEYVKWSWGLLLSLLVLAILIEPLFNSSPMMELVNLAIFEIALIGAVFASEAHKSLRIIICVFAAIRFAASIATLLGAPILGSVALLSTVLVIGAQVVTFNYLLKGREDSLNQLLGAVFGYLLLSVSWAILFIQIERWRPGSFLLPEQGDILSSFMYFSLVTITTLGYGDVLPVSSLARICAGFEAAIGVLYVTVMIGSIIGSFRGPDSADR